MKNCLPMTVAFVAVCVVICSPLQSDAEPVSPKPNQTASVEPHWQLFLDDYIIERSTGFRSVVHHPSPRGIVIPADKPWERLGLSPLYVGRRKDGTLECYYRVHGPFRYEATGYAISKDGIHWQKPNLGLIEDPGGGKDNNLLPCGSQPVNLVLCPA